MKLTPAQREELRRRYWEPRRALGLLDDERALRYPECPTMTALAREYGVSVVTAFRHITGGSIYGASAKPTKLPRGLWAEIEARHARGETLDALARAYGVSLTTISRVCWAVRREREASEEVA